MLSGANSLLVLAVVLVSGAVFGHLATRLRLPSVTGQILVGIVVGRSGLGLFDPVAGERLRSVTLFALGLIAVAVGSHLNLRRLRNAAQRLLALVVLEATLTPLIVFGAIIALPGVTWPLALLFAAMAVSTAPATIVALVKETHAKGVFTKTLIAAVALNNVACIFLFEVARAISRLALPSPDGPAGAALLLTPFIQLASAAALGILCGVALLLATRRVFRSDKLATASFVAILFTAGLADHLGISPLLACLFLGMSLTNLRPDREEIGHRVFEDFEGAILAVFFTLAGMEIELKHVIPAGLLSAALVASRFAGKMLAATLAMRLARTTDRVRKYLGLALMPQAGVAVGLMVFVKEEPSLAPIANLFLVVGLSSVALNEIVGPLLTRLALVRSRDAAMDRARLIDFLCEEHIIIDLEAATKTEAIGRLTDLLIRAHHLHIDRQQFLRSVLEREEQASTCIGDGLAIPHGLLDRGSGIVGVMGLSARGLPFETPDGNPVHCMVLLATPASERDRHLEVLATLARMVGSDRNIRQALFNARTAAHAAEVLHSDQSAEINPFLDQG